MESLFGCLIAGAFLAIGLWLRLDDWRRIERGRVLGLGGDDFDGGHSIFADTTGVSCAGGSCGHDGGCAGT